MSAPTVPPAHKPWSVFAIRAYALYWASRFLVTFSVQIVSVAVGWQVYDLTRDPLDLGIIGLVQFLPALALVLVTGSVADRYDRRLIMALCVAVEVTCIGGLLYLAWSGPTGVWPYFALMTGFGVARAFYGPATQALMPNLVPVERLPDAIAYNSSAWQVASIVGPVAGGLLYGVGVRVAYGVPLALMSLAVLLLAAIPVVAQSRNREPASWDNVVAGFRYVWNNRIVLGAISLDLFAVLLGGAVALLPAFARDILETGPWGLGLLRAAPGIGAVVVALWLGWKPIRDHAGIWMFVGVALYGVATVVFGLSETVWLSIAALALLGAGDMVSVYVRETLLQLATPDEVRGRVNAVNMVFVGASNELGEFRAGAMAAVIGVVPAVVFGGVGAVIVSGLWAWWFPQLRLARRLDGTDLPRG
ncbi:MAG TPA: MFS transporter [Azospirillaceae bacterium]|nr:MFS transporter [Azospirillaceae bacterium]